MMANKQRFLICALLVGLTLLMFVSHLSVNANEEINELDDGDKGLLKGFRLPSWNAYMQFFNKKYSSLTQQLLRQKLFIARAIEVFLTRIKYRLMKMSYFTAINEFSDSTPDEGRRMLSGDSGGEDTIEDEPQMDDEEAQKLLLETLNESLGSRREKRSLPENDDSLLNIRWRVPSNNPDYEPIHVDNELSNVSEEKVAHDIPAERATEIEIGADQNRYKLSEFASGGLGRMKSMIGGAFDWLSPNQSEGEGDIVSTVESAEENVEETIVIVDWRESGCMGPVRNQGDCLSCYAVSAIGFMEWALCRDHDNQMTPLSVQYMVSCGPQFKNETRGKFRLDGCQQGTSRHTVDFIREYGIELENNMPYLQQDTPCPLKPHTPRKRKGYFRPNAKPAIRLKSKTTQLDLALKTGPVIVGMWEPKNFLAYGGGMVEHCYQEGGHAMLIVGAMIENGEEYLMIKNSFGSRWGYGGYFKFRRSSIGECVKEFIVPRVSFPGKKAQARRIKAYLANQQTIYDDGDDNRELQVDDVIDTSILNN